MNQATATYTIAERAAFIVKMLKSGADPDQMTAAIQGELRSVEADAFERGAIKNQRDNNARANLGLEPKVSPF